MYRVKVLNLARAKVGRATFVRSVISTREKYSKYQIAFRKEWETREGPRLRLAAAFANIAFSLRRRDRRNARFAVDGRSKRRWMRKNSTNRCKSRKPSFRFRCSSSFHRSLNARCFRDCLRIDYSAAANAIISSKILLRLCSNQIVVHLTSFP